MKKIITAIMNQEINKQLKQEKNFEVVYDDIQYQEALFEIVEKKKNIDLIILSQTLPGSLDLINLIKKLKEINSEMELIVFLEKENEDLQTKLLINGINKIFYDRAITINDLIYSINNEYESENKKIKEELENLKKIILEKNTAPKKSIKNICNKYFIKKQVKNPKRQTKTIAISGTYGVGKSIFSSCISEKLCKNEIKTLLIDFDILNNSIHTIFGVKKYPKKFENNVDCLIHKINNNLDVLCGIDLLFNKQNVINKNKLKEILNKLKNNYEIIIIDTSSECFFKYTKLILEESDYIIYLVEPNLIEIKKSKNLLKIYTDEWNISKNKFEIILNKCDSESICDDLMKKIFSDFKIVGRIKYNKKYNLFINKNMKNILCEKKSEYKKIIQKTIFDKEKINE